jgi:pyruvate formate lyase activating enzyme
MLQGMITNIQRFSIHDGPGIRTTVFLKGCNLHCFWCHNPETLSPKAELQLFLDRCIACGECFRRCAQGAHVMLDGQRHFDRAKCIGCGACADTCYAQALVLAGEIKSVDEVVEVVLRDRPFYETSGGGVTLSGGEPLLQLEFSAAILQRCRDEGLHTAIETAANFSWARVASLLPVTDLVMVDVKLIDADRHKKHTGVSNRRILENVRRLGQAARSLIVRTPIVPGVNDNPQDIVAIASFVASLPNLQYYELLPFHPLARGKYDSLQRAYEAQSLAIPPREHMDRLVEAAQESGISVRHG